MSLPGLQLNSVPVEEKQSTVQELSPGTEWRFEVAFGDTVEVKLISGTAEIFGTELALNQPYTFTGRKAAIYTWPGCRLEVTGACQIDYTAEETPMISHANLHFALEDLRIASSETNTMGPRVLVVGPENAGKTSLVKLLAAYATRSERQPVVVNLDPKEGLLSVPGTLSTFVLDSIIDVEEGWGSSPTNGPSQIPTKLPLVYYYGMEDPEAQGEFYKPLVTRLALSVMNRLEEDKEAKFSGCIVDTSGSVSHGKGGYDIVNHIVAEFSINVLVVVGSERLYSDMTRRFSKPTASRDAVAVIKLDKSGGCVDRDIDFMKQSQKAQIREYFDGDIRNPLNPYTQYVDFNDIVVYRYAEKSNIMASLLPGDAIEDGPADDIFEKIQPSSEMQNSILAIVQADPNDKHESVRDASVIGFIYVKEVDEKKRKLLVGAPLSGRLPSRVLIWGAFPEPFAGLFG